MKRRVSVNKARSFKEAEEFDRKYYAKMTPEERLSIVQELREIYLKFPQKGRKGVLRYANRARLRRVVRVV